MNIKYNTISKIIKEMMNSSVSFSAYETPATEVIPKKKKKKTDEDDEPTMFKPEYPN
jgi:hypothetical protein